MYTEITEVSAPSEAAVGQTVPVTIAIKNNHSASLHIAAVGLYADVTFINWLKYWISSGGSHSFSGSFIMPDHAVTIYAYSYYESGGYWNLDTYTPKNVSLGVLQAAFSGFDINFTKTVKV
jgi:hypothetical protein